MNPQRLAASGVGTPSCGNLRASTTHWAEAEKQRGEFRHYKSIDLGPLRLCDPSIRTNYPPGCRTGVDVGGNECYLVDPIDRIDVAKEFFCAINP